MAILNKRQGGTAQYVGMKENGPYRVRVQPRPDLNPRLRMDPYWMQPDFDPPILQPGIMGAVYGGGDEPKPVLAYLGMASLGAAGAFLAGKAGVKSKLLVGAILGAGAYAVVREWGGPGGLYVDPITEPRSV